MKTIFSDTDSGFIEFDDEIFMLQTELKKLRDYTHNKQPNKQATPKYLLVINELD